MVDAVYEMLYTSEGAMAKQAAIVLQMMGTEEAVNALRNFTFGKAGKSENPSLSPFAGLEETVARVKVPVGVGTFSVEDGKTAFRLGASMHGR